MFGCRPQTCIHLCLAAGHKPVFTYALLFQFMPRVGQNTRHVVHESDYIIFVYQLVPLPLSTFTAWTRKTLPVPFFTLSFLTIQ
jgi:hypothetical protein